MGVAAGGVGGVGVAAVPDPAFLPTLGLEGGEGNLGLERLLCEDLGSEVGVAALLGGGGVAGRAAAGGGGGGEEQLLLLLLLLLQLLPLLRCGFLGGRSGGVAGEGALLGGRGRSSSSSSSSRPPPLLFLVGVAPRAAGAALGHVDVGPLLQVDGPGTKNEEKREKF